MDKNQTIDKQIREIESSMPGIKTAIKKQHQAYEEDVQTTPKYHVIVDRYNLNTENISYTELNRYKILAEKVVGQKERKTLNTRALFIKAGIEQKELAPTIETPCTGIIMYFQKDGEKKIVSKKRIFDNTIESNIDSEIKFSQEYVQDNIIVAYLSNDKSKTLPINLRLIEREYRKK